MYRWVVLEHTSGVCISGSLRAASRTCLLVYFCRCWYCARQCLRWFTTVPKLNILARVHAVNSRTSKRLYAHLYQNDLHLLSQRSCCHTSLFTLLNLHCCVSTALLTAAFLYHIIVSCIFSVFALNYPSFSFFIFDQRRDDGWKK